VNSPLDRIQKMAANLQTLRDAAPLAGNPVRKDRAAQRFRTTLESYLADPDDHPGRTSGAAFPGRTIEDRCAHWLAARRSYAEGLISEADLDRITAAFDAALDAEFTDLLRRS
jgi:hypothetical protein